MTDNKKVKQNKKKEKLKNALFKSLIFKVEIICFSLFIFNAINPFIISSELTVGSRYWNINYNGN